MLTPLQIQQAESAVRESEEQIMNTNKNDGGPAFPSGPLDRVALPGCEAGPVRGLSKREWFAGMALSNMRVGDWADCKDGAKYCVDYADALIAELEKP